MRQPCPQRLSEEADPLAAEWEWLLAQTDDNRVVPPANVASPAQVGTQPNETITWWKPSWRDAWLHLGWRWIFLLPVLGLIVLLVPLLRWPSVLSPFLPIGIQYATFVGAIVITLAGFAVRRAVRARREPFCIFCGYNLRGLPDHYRCPECGRPYTWRLIAEYRRDPLWFIERYRAARKLPEMHAPFAAGAWRRKTRDGT